MKTAKGRGAKFLKILYSPRKALSGAARLNLQKARLSLRQAHRAEIMDYPTQPGNAAAHRAQAGKEIAAAVKYRMASRAMRAAYAPVRFLLRAGAKAARKPRPRTGAKP